MSKEGASPTADTPDGLGCLPTPSSHDPSPARPVSRLQGKGLASYSGQPCARLRHSRVRPRAPAIKTFRLCASAPPAAPLPPLHAASSLRSPRSPLSRSGPVPEIPVTGLAFHLRNRGPDDSRGSDDSVGLGRNHSARPGVCHSLSLAASMTNEHGGVETGWPILGFEGETKGSRRALSGQRTNRALYVGAGLRCGGCCLSSSLHRSDKIAVVLQKSRRGTVDVLTAQQLGSCGAASEGWEESTRFSHCWSSSHG